MSKVLSDAEVERYGEAGILFPIRVLSAAEAATYCDACNDLERRLGGKPRAVELTQTHLHFPWAYELVTHPRVLDAVEDVIGPDIVVWSTSIFAKHPHDPGYISWHQDGTYWGLNSTQVTTAWIALSESTVENGCMRIVAGTHREPVHPHRDTYATNNLLSRGQEIEVQVSEDEATDVVLAAGEMSLHHVNIIHGSNANGSDVKRVGYAIRYVTPEVEQAGQRPRAVLARGKDDFGHYELCGPPPERDMDTAVAEMKEATARFLSSILDGKN